jgi:hypothetical protein
VVNDVNITHVVVNEHGPIFYELIDLTVDALRDSGVKTDQGVNQVSPDKLNLIIGHTVFLPPNIFSEIRSQTPNYIVFQLEALDGEQGFLSRYPAYSEFLRGAKQVWDYSQQNILYLSALGIPAVHYIPIGYSPRLERIIDRRERDIDVLFYGAVTSRRQKILHDLSRRGLKVAAIFRAYGQARDDHIGRANIQLNIHQFETSQLEQLRISYLLNNRRFVISENSSDNPYGEGVIFCAYKNIVDCCVDFLKPEMEAERSRVSELGYKSLKGIPMKRSVFEALSELASA